MANERKKRFINTYDEQAGNQGTEKRIVLRGAKPIADEAEQHLTSVMANDGQSEASGTAAAQSQLAETIVQESSKLDEELSP